MSPEERAAQFSWKQCSGGEGHDPGEEGFAYACAACNAAEFRAAEDDALAPVRDLLATWESNRAAPNYGTGSPGPLFAAGMASEADSMIAGLRSAIEKQGTP